MTEGPRPIRLKVLAGLVAFMFAALGTRLWFLQVMATEEYQAAAQSNRVRLVPQPAPRGQILDRHGQTLIENRLSIQVTVNPRAVQNKEALIFRLAQILGMSAETVSQRLEDPKFLPYQPIPVTDDAPEDVVAQIEEHYREFRGVEYQEIGLRDHRYGPLAAHVLGYLGEVSPQELKDPDFSEYRPGAVVGRGGVEQVYEQYLRGEEGWAKLEVDAQGKVLDVLGRSEPKAGNDLALTLDRRIQQLAETSLQQGVAAARRIVDSESGIYLKAPAGSVVVMDPDNGDVLAMASFPTFSPRLATDGFSAREWRLLNSKRKNYPLNNRATQGLYPAGSTLKPFVAAAAVKSDIANLNGYYDCPPEFRVPGDTSGTVFHNWTDQDLGFLSLGEALIQSCDTVFYRYGLDFYGDRDLRGDVFQNTLRRWGFGRPTGVDLVAEEEGRVPDEQWKQTVHQKYPKLYPQPLWLPGDSINLSIGQGDLLVTPLQMASAYAALANRGTLYRPRLGLHVQAPDGDVIKEFKPKVEAQVPVKRRILTSIMGALRGVPATGTAASAFVGFPLESIPVAGKTGTAEVAGKQPHSWFAAAAPANDPKYVVVAMVEEGGHGSEVAAPIVRRILEGLFGLGASGFHVGAAVD